MLLCLNGTIFLYQGEELGMPNPYFKDLSMYNDVDTLTRYKEFVEDLKIMSHEKFMEGILKNSRDNARCPMQWNNKANAGFNSGATPWLSINSDYKEINRDNQISDPNSVFSFYKNLIHLRKNVLSEVLLTSDYIDLSSTYDIDTLFIYQRKNNDCN